MGYLLVSAGTAGNMPLNQVGNSSDKPLFAELFSFVCSYFVSEKFIFKSGEEVAI